MAPQRIHTVEDFGFQKRSDSRYAFGWKFGERRYHLWVYLKDGTLQLDSDLHSNHVDRKVPGYGPRGHKKLDPLAKAWLPMFGDLHEALTPELIAEADAKYAKAEHDERERQDNQRYDRLVGQINKLIDNKERPVDGKSRNVFNALLTIPRDDLLRLM